MTILLTGVSLSFRLAEGSTREVLRNVSLTIPEGCLFGLIGPGASGKSVLLKCVSGLLRPQRGEVHVAGQALSKLSDRALFPVRGKMGMLFQNHALFEHLSVYENVAFPLRRLTALDERSISECVRERLARVSLTGFEARTPPGLSGGQKKRVGLARATITQAPYLLFDEPAAGLDPVTSQRIFNLLREEQRQRAATCLMVSSDLERLLSVVDQVGMLYRGEIVFVGTPEQARDAENPYVRQFVRGLAEGPL